MAALRRQWCVGADRDDFSEATCYAGATGRERPRADLDIVTETSVTEFRWATASTVSEGELFAINGENVWLHKWLKTGDDAVQLPHPDYPVQTYRFNVYRIEKLAGGRAICCF